MAYLISGPSDHDWTAASWGEAEDGAGAQQMVVNSGNSAIQTYRWSPSFTFTSGHECDGVLLKLYNVTNLTGTVTVCLSEDGATETRTCTVNMADLPICDVGSLNINSWIFFKFSSPVTGDGNSTWSVGIKSDYSGDPVFCSSGSFNWTRLLRLTSTAAPGAGDQCFVVGELTGQGTGNARVVTFDETVASRGDASTDYGELNISGGATATGKLQWANAASTHYSMKISGHIQVYQGGIWQRGTVESPIQASSTADLLFDCAVSVEFGMTVQSGGIVEEAGIIPSVVWTYLAADASPSDTEIVSAVETGWKSGDEVAIAPTSTTYTQRESKTMTGDASGTTIPLGSLSYAHSGTQPTRAEIMVINRNVKTSGNGTTTACFINFDRRADVTWSGIEVMYCGANASGKYGIGVELGVGSFSADGCSFHDNTTGASAIRITCTDPAADVEITNCVFYSPGTNGININAGDQGAPIISNTVHMGMTGVGMTVGHVRGAISDTIIAGFGGSYGFNALQAGGGEIGTFANNVVHSSTGHGLYMVGIVGGVIENFTAWHNGDNGMYLSQCSNITIDGATIFGNNDGAIALNDCWDITIDDLVADGGSAYLQNYGLAITKNCRAALHDCSFGTTVPHDVATILIGSTGYFVDVLAVNTIMAETDEVWAQSYMAEGSAIRSHDHDQTPGTHRMWTPYGTVKNDAIIYHTAAPSQRLVPQSASNKLESAGKYGGTMVSLVPGVEKSVSAWVRLSGLLDGAIYNGSVPRLIVKANPTAGIGSDTVIGTVEGDWGPMMWAQITGALPMVTQKCLLRLVVDADGTSGWINVDDWGVE